MRYIGTFQPLVSVALSEQILTITNYNGNILFKFNISRMDYQVTIEQAGIFFWYFSVYYGIIIVTLFELRKEG